MLYVSRMFPVGCSYGYGVVDDTTGEEQFVPYDKLQEFFDKGIPVLGLEPFHGMGSFCFKVKPYQDQKWLKRIQAKTAMMTGVVVTTYKDTVTALEWDSRKIKRPVSIRLSDFGKYCAGDLLRSVICWGDGQPVTLILDDKINFQRLSFSLPVSLDGVPNHEVYIDIREVSSVFRLSRLSWMFGAAMWDNCFIDRDNRIEEILDAGRGWRLWLLWMKSFLKSFKQ